MNLEHIASTHRLIADYEKLDKLPVNPPGSYFAEGDVMMSEIEIANWDTDGAYYFEPRLRDFVQEVTRDSRPPRAAGDDEAPELDLEYDCD